MRKLNTPKKICISTLRFLFENTHTDTHTHTEKLIELYLQMWNAYYPADYENMQICR